jgi:DnaK suppressor protein
MREARLREYAETARPRLLARREVLVNRLALVRKNILDATTDQLLEGTFATHLADEATDMIDAEVNVSDVGVIEDKIEEIDAALARISHGTYGVCTDCGEPIDPARLKALPAAERCIRCQTRIELKEE